MPSPAPNAGYGAYNLSAGSLNASVLGMSGGEYIGFAGTGVFNQSGGTNIAGELCSEEQMRYTATGSVIITPGMYNLSGGLLQAYVLNAIGNLGTLSPYNAFTVSGGTLQASANPETS